MHPEGYNPDAHLWITFDSKTDALKPLQYAAIRTKLQRIAKKAGINKRIHPHLFRNSRCTYMANYLTEAQMNVYFGWTQGSDMPGVYVHLSGRDINDAILKANRVFGKETPNLTQNIETPKVDLSSIIEAKVKKLERQKLQNY